MYGPSKDHTQPATQQAGLTGKFKNTQGGGGDALHPDWSGACQYCNVAASRCKKGLVYLRPEFIGDFLEGPHQVSHTPDPRCLIATPSLAFSEYLFRGVEKFFEHRTIVSKPSVLQHFFTLRNY